MKTRALGALLSGLAVVAVASAPASGTETTPGCATHTEWENVQPFMEPQRIEQIIGNDGWWIFTENPDTFARGYNLCWTANFGKVWFDGQSRLSIRKDIIEQ